MKFINIMWCLIEIFTLMVKLLITIIIVLSLDLLYNIQLHHLLSANCVHTIKIHQQIGFQQLGQVFFETETLLTLTRVDTAGIVQNIRYQASLVSQTQQECKAGTLHHKYFVIPTVNTTKYIASSMCSKLDAALPEPLTSDDRASLMTFMQRNNLSSIHLGAFFKYDVYNHIYPESGRLVSASLMHLESEDRATGQKSEWIDLIDDRPVSFHLDEHGNIRHSLNSKDYTPYHNMYRLNKKKYNSKGFLDVTRVTYPTDQVICQRKHPLPDCRDMARLIYDRYLTQLTAYNSILLNSDLSLSLVLKDLVRSLF
jgi:hypothetical protein